MSVKESVLDLVEQLPDDVTLSDILYELYVRHEIEEGIRELDAGQGIPHEEAMKRLARWLK
jgi:predicted transcriptional regulator